MTNQKNPWNKTSYGAITGSGATKLADSKVAPLVALARGYYRVADKTQTKALAERATAATSVISLTRQLNTLIASDEDILVMPWFALSAVSDMGMSAKSYNTQYRPSKPIRDAEGKTRKYAWFAGERLVIDLHPATPVEWLDDSLTVLMTEGVIKGDSALTSVLLDSGISVDVLSETPSPEEARSRLNALMLGIPKSRRVPIVNSASVTTWEDQNDQWRHIRFTDKRVVIAFDGDLAENRMVWKQTKNAMRFVQDRKGRPVILDLFGVEVATAQIEAGMDPADKLGIDDYLSKVGTWETLMSLQTDRLPDEPEAAERQASVGEWRVHPGNAARVQEYAQEQNPDGSKKPAQWMDRYRVGGRVVNTTAKRRPTAQEIRSGVVDAYQEMLLASAECEIEVALLDPGLDWDQEPTLHRVVGPATMLALPPSEWPKHASTLPNEVLNHPDWPPRKGQDWMSAVKANQRDAVEQVIAWNTMGWVPVHEGHPAFIIGNQVLGKTEKDELRTKTGVTENSLPGMSGFGLVDDFRTMSPEDYKAQVRSDIKRTLKVFIDNGFWTNQSTGVCVLAAMMRPTIPLRPGITLYFVGPRRAGKSHSAGFVLSGWESRYGTWNGSNLNGQASDTAASVEHAVAHSPIWIVDDLAPQPDRRKAEEQESAIAQIIRGVHNGSARRRMDGKTMTQREVANPIALLVLTAENPPNVASIQERIISIRVPRGAFDDTEGRWRERELDDAIAEGIPSRLNAAMVRLWMQDDAGMGTTWGERQRHLNAMFAAERDVALEELSAGYGIEHGEAARHAAQIASLGLSLQVLYDLALWAGLDASDPALQRFGSGKDSYMNALYEMAAASIKKARQGSPGRALTEAIARLLASGKAHLRNPTTAGAPPFVNRESDDTGATRLGGMNEALGWEFSRDTWTPKGTPIGYYGVNAEGEQVCLIDTQTGFQEAKRSFPALIPHGQTAPSSWDSVWQEGLAIPAAKPRPGSAAARVSISEGPEASSERLSGVPLKLSSLLDASIDD